MTRPFLINLHRKVQSRSFPIRNGFGRFRFLDRLEKIIIVILITRSTQALGQSLGMYDTFRGFEFHRIRSGRQSSIKIKNGLDYGWRWRFLCFVLVIQKGHSRGDGRHGLNFHGQGFTTGMSSHGNASQECRSGGDRFDRCRHDGNLGQPFGFGTRFLIRRQGHGQGILFQVGTIGENGRGTIHFRGDQFQNLIQFRQTRRQQGSGFLFGLAVRVVVTVMLTLGQ
mmetsp:Transcript_3274/g.6770  ORF Transcript_3274/g.6770 Transcript_3274/m.6770 type:complete len:225 (-) Transcript_3274:623-1297(-)